MLAEKTVLLPFRGVFYIVTAMNSLDLPCVLTRRHTGPSPRQSGASSCYGLRTMLVSNWQVARTLRTQYDVAYLPNS